MNEPEEDHPPPLDASGEVRRFNDRHPYPHPVNSLEKYRRLWQAAVHFFR